MEHIIIFGAKYLYILAPLVGLVYFVRADRDTQKRMLIFALVFLPMAFLLAQGARAMYYNPRPFVVGDFAPLVAHEADNGFPSDHTLFVSAVAALFLYFNNRASLALWVIAALVGISRVAAGIHHFLDIGASMAISILCAILVHKLLTIYARQQ